MKAEKEKKNNADWLHLFRQSRKASYYYAENPSRTFKKYGEGGKKRGRIASKP